MNNTTDGEVQVGVGGPCGGPNNTFWITVEAVVKNHLPQLMPGKLISYVTDSSGTHKAYSTYTIPGTAPVLSYSYGAADQLETATVRHEFCYNTLPNSTMLYFYFQVYDREGNRSNDMHCAGEVNPPGTFNCDSN